MPTLIHERVRACRAGENPKAIARLASGWVVIGDVQPLPGYALLLSDPVVDDLNALGEEQRAGFLGDMALLGDALLEVTEASRINYEILGNAEPALHAHVVPRYAWEPLPQRQQPPWSYDWSVATPFDPAGDRQLMVAIAVVLTRHGAREALVG